MCFDGEHGVHYEAVGVEVEEMLRVRVEGHCVAHCWDARPGRWGDGVGDVVVGCFGDKGSVAWIIPVVR